ncbi:DUF523 domain-containing protein [Salipaludibacillus agaradhaerens]|uniref:DUF523 domain-containing protein n=1 Tax=Salipaludibacillus agaradhaerens TaxID=76935 RepID=A0A9Q4FZT6_SALAG|nr:DUF523 domain-containing protein [Salipaludibacillus agaradhaerens]MCR6097143.1 DUF523 domain-containing protein [Salipaludibacillus agaradhaerens]MCR6113372.1 DUF523 domain-containing protein [Salipaludibacillus agaradhaerens]
MILVSACLAGENVRYNGTNSLNTKIRQLVETGQATMVCPELLGGFSTPREPAEIIDGTGEDVLDGKASVIERSGRDVTELYIKGACLTLEQANILQAKLVVLKEFSPSCGSRSIYNGTFDGVTRTGNGVTAALLARSGFQVISEEEFVKIHS